MILTAAFRRWVSSWVGAGAASAGALRIRVVKRCRFQGMRFASLSEGKSLLAAGAASACALCVAAMTAEAVTAETSTAFRRARFHCSNRPCLLASCSEQKANAKSSREDRWNRQMVWEVPGVRRLCVESHVRSGEASSVQW